MTPFWQFIRAVAVAIVRAMGWRVDVQGLEHVPTEGGAILAFNHHSYFDFVMVAWDVVRKLHRPVRFLAKSELWDSKVVGPIVRTAHAVPVDRGSRTSRAGAYDAAVAALQAGDLVAVAPEQTVSVSFQLLPFRTGAARMAIAAGVPIIPVIGWGTQRFASKGNGIHFAWRIPVTVRYGEPIPVSRDDDPRELTSRLQQAMEALLDDVQRRYPDPALPGNDWWQPAALGGTAPSHAQVVAQHRARAEGGWGEHLEGDGNPAA